jgi:uncharacterized membrane protein HdeD (DUF308 family)
MLWHALLALLYLVVGSLILLNPLGGAVALTLMVAVFLVASSIARRLLTFAVRPRDGWAGSVSAEF